MRKLLISALTALLSLAGQAHATDPWSKDGYALWKDVGGWKITGKDNHCMMMGFYQHNSTGIVLSADSDAGALLIVAGMNWKGRWSTAQPVAVELYFDGNHQATPATASRDDGIVIPLSEQGVREFMAARYMAIREGGEVLGAWGLKGTRAATMELSSCYDAMIGNTM